MRARAASRELVGVATGRGTARKGCSVNPEGTVLTRVLGWSTYPQAHEHRSRGPQLLRTPRSPHRFVSFAEQYQLRKSSGETILSLATSSWVSRTSCGGAALEDVLRTQSSPANDNRGLHSDGIPAPETLHTVSEVARELRVSHALAAARESFDVSTTDVVRSDRSRGRWSHAVEALQLPRIGAKEPHPSPAWAGARGCLSRRPTNLDDALLPVSHRRRWLEQV